MSAFPYVLSQCELRDLGFVGSNFTWCDYREGDERIYARLDRCVANLSWFDLFPKGRVRHGTVVHSNHIPIWLET